MIWLARHLEQEPPARGGALKYLPPLLDAKSPGPATAEAAFVGRRSPARCPGLPAALAAFRRVVSLSHGFELEARLEIGRTLVAAGQTDAALSEYGGLISAEPSAIASAAIYDSAKIHRQRARQKQQAHETEAARHELDRGPQALQAAWCCSSRSRSSPLCPS